MESGDPAALVAGVTARFRDLTGRDPVGCFAAPGRVNLIGEHLDYNGGFCLPIALPHATYAAVGRREDDTVRVLSRQQDEPWHGRLDALGPGAVDGWPAYVVGVAWALQQEGWRLPGMDIVVDSRVPVGAGLSSSAALECAVALGLCALAGRPVDDDLRRQLVTACMRAEREVAGAPTGGMDQTIALLAQADHALLLDCRDGSVEQVRWDPSAAGYELLVVDTHAEHALNDGGYEARRKDCEEAAAALGVGLLRDVDQPAAALPRLRDARVRRRARHVFSELARVEQAVTQIRSGDFDALGVTFTASHASLRDDFEVSCAELDAVVDVAVAHGALGARMTGGGFGGSAIALVPQVSTGEVEQAVAAEFAARGWPAPGFTAVAAGPGAHRIG